MSDDQTKEESTEDSLNLNLQQQVPNTTTTTNHENQETILNPDKEDVNQLTTSNQSSYAPELIAHEQTTITNTTIEVPITKSCDTNESTTTTTNITTNPTTSTNNKDVEKFGGKIVYNPDGSAYIIEDGDLSDDESLPLPKQEGCIVEKPDEEKAEGQETPSYPLIANAIYVTRSAAYYNALYGQAYAKIFKDKLGPMPEAPIVHSYKVYSLRQDQVPFPNVEPEPPLLEYSTVPVKPILMCFVCKLSFGFAPSFVSHCTGEHHIQLSDKEKSILDAKNSSAIIQLVGKDKDPVLSFLEPVVKKVPSAVATNNSTALEPKEQVLSPNAIKGLLTAAMSQQQQQKMGAPSQQQNVAPTIIPESPTGSSSRMMFPPVVGAADPKLLPNLPPFLANAMAAANAGGNLLENISSAQAMLRNSLESMARRSSPLDNGRSSVSPVTSSSMAPSPLLPLPPGMQNNDGNNPMQGTTIGACPEHINGRQTGQECANCDMILNSSRMPGGVAWNAARNSCKTLKCPKCNWHYKYQETLEIHMKEKHPENDATCIYCITGQQHPRLARGETYTCGYKPYRCEVCNYSTTTKGNLSIHTQSDKHLNNMQELQKGGVVTSPDGTKVSKGPAGGFPVNPAALLGNMAGNPLAALVKQKPNWRCDVCNYETNVARNLRIHMTSEKHTHNIMVLQQNVKHMQQLGANPGGPPGPGGNGGPHSGPPPPPGGALFPNLPGLDPQQLLQLQLGGLGNLPGGPPGGPDKPGQSEAAMADMAYLQALMMQMMTGGQFPPGPHPGEFSLSPTGGSNGGGGGAGGGASGSVDSGLNPEAMEPPPEPAEPNPRSLFNCCVCKEFNCDSMEVMSQHLTLDRTRMREDEVSVVIAGNSICKLCNYKTNLKANFQLHCKTDKHLQRLNHVNHIKEGGPANEWKLKFLNIANPVQLRCNACDYYTNSLHKLQLHVSNQRHEISNILFSHLKKSEEAFPEDRRSYLCILCKFSSNGKLGLMTHVRSMKHLQMEQIHQLQKRAEGNAEQTEIGDIFQVVEMDDRSNESNAEDDTESQKDQKTSSKDEDQPSNDSTEDPPCPTPCPLCQEPYAEYAELENHVMQIHSVNSDGLQRLLVLMEGSHWLNNKRNNNNISHNSNNNSDCESPSTTTNHHDQATLEAVEDDKKEEETPSSTTSETPLGTISEKHVYKYRCAQCSLAFKTAEKLALHSQYHVIRDSTKCRLCSRSFRSVQALLKHVESSHDDVPTEELAHYKLGLMNHPLLLAGLSGQILDSSTNELLRKESVRDNDTINEMDTSNEEANEMSPQDSSSKSKSLLHSTFSRKSDGSKSGMNYPLEKYLDPNRPYKCDVCKESFTQKNILLVHYNSVSHLHRLKKSMQNELLSGGGGGLQTPEKSPSPRVMTSLESALSNLANAKQIRDMDESDKPYKCNICRVSYNQGSTLDIHIRSVLHQTRASKLQELALSGQIDLSKPLIEQPDSKQLQEQHKKILQDMLSPKSSFNSSSSSSSNPALSPPQQAVATAAAPPPPPVPAPSSPLLNLQQALLNAKHQQQNLSPPQPASIMELLSGNANEQSQQQFLQFLQTLQQGSTTGNNNNNHDGPNQQQQQEEQTLAKPQQQQQPQTAVKNLLENYGLELVMQFNENHQRRLREEEKRKQENEHQEENNAVKSVDNQSNSTNNEGIMQSSIDTLSSLRKDGENEVVNNDEEITKQKETLIKDHHNTDEEQRNDQDVASLDRERVDDDDEIHSKKSSSEEIRKSFEQEDHLQQQHNQQQTTPIKQITASTFLTPEKSSEGGDERLNFPETSTPKSRSSTPAVESTEGGGQSANKVNQQQQPSFLPKELNLADFSNNFQKAMLSAQQQSQSINPMLLQMAQFQGMNPLVAMNLHPPLIPPSILAAQQGNSNQNGLPPNMSSPGKPPGANEAMDPAQLQLMMKLGIDPKMLAQSGLDPKVILQMSQLGNSGPKLPDPGLLSLLGGMNENAAAPDPKMLFQMMQMGLPQGPDPKMLLQLMGKDPMGLPGMADKNNMPPFPGMPNAQSIMGQKPVFQQPEQTKRARTRITDDQLKVLRSNFDINNSPTEEQIHNMAGQTGLPPKVIKHWFRNTLFKERQKNKDSPYNFNNPPSTMLNLEEYERTGEPKVTPLDPEEQKQYFDKPSNEDNTSKKETDKAGEEISRPPTAELRVKNNDELLNSTKDNISISSASPPISTPSSAALAAVISSSSLETSASPSLTLSSILSSQMGQLPGVKPGSFLPHPLVPNFPSSASPLGGRLPDFLNPLANMMANEQPQQQRSPTPQSQQGSSHQGKRANRTRFTDYQIKVLQEFFENNAYPKDDDLEYLSKLLSLSPRVIVVWFQNARQKARKIYENQPPIDPTDDGAGRFTRTPGLNYQCKKCLLVFQRYYELIRHQKQHCFKEEDAKRSAQAQKAAAQAAAQFSNQQIGPAGPGGASIPTTSSSFLLNTSHHSDDSNSSADRAIQSPMFNHNFPGLDKRRSMDGSEDWSSASASAEPHNFGGGLPPHEEKKITPSMFDQLTRETNREPPGGLFPKLTAPSTLFPSYPPSSPFGILQQQALQNQARDRDSDDFDTESVGSSPSSNSNKRKHSEDGLTIEYSNSEDKDESGQPRDKRLRTTILPEQLDYLYQKYQIESNPSRKMLEQIANEVGLRKRVVQVWFQNTRARERKGQFRAHQQVINKRCPFCPAIFRVRSALESHLATKHADHYTRGEIDIDALPDADGGFLEPVERSASTPNSVPPLAPLVPTTTDQLHSMQKYYEDTMKRYMNDLQNNSNNISNNSREEPQPQPHLGDANHKSATSSALDLTTTPTSYSTSAPTGNPGGTAVLDPYDFDLTEAAETSLDHPLGGSGPQSPASSEKSNNSKRFRTQMSSLQVKMMKSVFQWYKTPTMAECTTLGLEIGLAKRVIQVWFQNARAKDKKAKLQTSSVGVGLLSEPMDPPPPNECPLCQYPLTESGLPVHLFSSDHLNKVKEAIQSGQLEPQSPGEHWIQRGGGQNENATTNTTTKETNVDKSLMDLVYGYGHGITSYPKGVAASNPFLHPALFSATSGK